MQHVLLIIAPYLSQNQDRNYNLVCLVAMMLVQKLENSNEHLSLKEVAQYMGV
jgi:hypothetical protein